MGMPEDLNPIYGSAQWEKLSQAERDELSHHLSSWLFSQFLRGEQGALTARRRADRRTHGRRTGRRVRRPGGRG
jgi:hypothetical protein